MATAVSTVFERRFAYSVTLALLAVTIVASLFASVPLPKVTAFLPIYTTLACAGDALTAFLLFGQARANRRASLNVLALAYAYSALVIVAHVLVFPGVFAPGGLLGATTQTAVWFWAWWHGGFPLFVSAYVLVDRAYARRESSVHVPVYLPILAVTVLALFVAGLLAFTVRGDAILPKIIVAGNYRALLTTGVGPSVVASLTLAIGLLVVVTRLRFVTNIWLAVALLAMLLDVLLTLAGGGRFTLGWYVARLESLFAAFVVLLSFLGAISRMYEQLARTASIDGLTGANNRRSFDEHLGSTHAASLRAKVPLSVVIFDVDHFKGFNDTYGHVAGDQCLREVAAAAVGELTRRADYLARYGGEEFALVLLGADEAGARRVAERVRLAIRARNIPNERSERGIVTASFGIFGFDPNRECMLSPGELVERADSALYRAKDAGRDCVVAFRDGRVVDTVTPSLAATTLN